MSAATATPDRLTYSDLIDLDERFLGLERYTTHLAAVEDRKGRRGCEARPWRELQPQLAELAGARRHPPHEVLSTGSAYAVAAEHLLGLLPDCREACPCLAV